jgi:hypothetical protein
MKIVVIATRKADAKPEAFAPHHDAALVMYRDEIVREIYSRTDGKGAILVLECRDEAHALQVLQTLPLARAGLLSFEIYGAKPYRGIVQHVK